jgi:hypothetical protein
VQQNALHLETKDVIILEKYHDKQRLYGIFNVTSQVVILDLKVLKNQNILQFEKDLIQNRIVTLEQEFVALAPYEILYLPAKTA